MRDFFQKIEIIILFYTLHLTCVHIFAEIGRFTAEILGGGGHNAPPPPPGCSKTSNSPALLGLRQISYGGLRLLLVALN